MLAYAFGTFRFLTQKESAALTAEQKAKYDEYSVLFIKEFKEKHPNGFDAVLTIDKLGTMYQKADPKTKEICAYGVIGVSTDESPAFVPAIQELKQGQLDVIARNAGMPNWQVLALMAATALRKGTVSMTLVLREKGDTYVQNGVTKTIQSTHLNVEDMELVLSESIKHNQEKAIGKAAEQSFANMMNFSITGATPKAPAGEKEDDETPNL